MNKDLLILGTVVVGGIILLKIPGKVAESVGSAATKVITDVPSGLVRGLTEDLFDTKASPTNSDICPVPKYMQGAPSNVNRLLFEPFGLFKYTKGLGDPNVWWG